MKAPGLASLISGNENSFRDLVSQYRNRVFNTALGLIQQTENAEDVTQDVFIEIFRSISRFKGECSLSTWIYKITVRKSLEHIRNSHRKKRNGIILSIFGKEDQLNIPSNGPFYHPGVRLENKERAVALFSAIARLPMKQRTAFTLHKVEGLSHAEISSIMGCSVSSVESLMFRAQRNLRALLSDYYEKTEK